MSHLLVTEYLCVCLYRKISLTAEPIFSYLIDPESWEGLLLFLGKVEPFKIFLLKLNLQMGGGSTLPSSSIALRPLGA